MSRRTGASGTAPFDRAHVIANPVASRLRVAARRAALVDAAVAALRSDGAGRVEAVEAGSAEELRRAAREAVDDAARLVVAIGGDGTLRELATVLAGTPVTLAVVPAGTGNLFAAGMSIPRRPSAALGLLHDGTVATIDTGVARAMGRTAEPSTLPALSNSGFMVACGTGFDARMLHAVSHHGKARRGIGAYVMSALAEAADLRPRPTVIDVDGRRLETTSVVVLAANAGVLVPGLLRPRLPVDPTDGLLDLFVVSAGGALRGLTGAVELLLATGHGPTRTGSGLRLRGRSIKIEVEPAQLVQVDGDPFAAGGLEASVRPGSLQVLVPTSAAGRPTR